jgi:phospholipase A1
VVSGQSILQQSSEITNKSFSEAWELDSIYQSGIFKIKAYKPVYLMLARWSDSPNNQPTSENPIYSAPFPIDYNNVEVKFQISLKTKLWQGVFGDFGDLWAGYTQQAHWQSYNKDLSRPFRELNYEPEIILNFPARLSAFGFKMQSYGIGFNHESNGKTIPQSRSWNRIMFHAAIEKNDWQIILKPWFRLTDRRDENPNITNSLGRAEITVIWTVNEKNALYCLTNQPFNSINYGNYQVNYIFRLAGNLKGLVQVFHGYGETLIDYNHRQTTLGFGVSFVEW